MIYIHLKWVIVVAKVNLTPRPPRRPWKPLLYACACGRHVT